MASEISNRDIELWRAWKDDPSPETLNPLMKQIQPIVIKESNKWLQSGINPVLLKNNAFSLAYESLHTYDPSKSQLNTHVTNHLKKMSRYVLQHQNAIRVPEEKTYDYRKFIKAKEELEQELGREPSAMEMKDKLGFGDKISAYHPLVEHFYSKATEAGGSPVMEELSMDATALALLHNSLNPAQKYIFSHSYGYKGAPILQNQAIAKKLKISPAAVSKQKRHIDDRYRAYIDATEFVSS